MKKFVVVIISFLFYGTFFAQGTANSGLSFLKIGFDARNVALGDVAVISASDVTASAYNPALLALSDDSQISFTHNAWMKDVASELIGAKFNLLGLNFGLSINSTSIKNIEIRQNPGEAVGSFNSSYFSGGISAGYKVNGNIAIGAGIKYIYESLFAYDALGYGIDLGGYYSNIIDNLNVSFAVQNIGKMNKLMNEETTLPSSFSFGAKYDLPLNINSFNSKAFFAVRKYFGENATHFNFAAEGVYKKRLFVRLGYQTGYEARSYSLGIGFAWRGFIIDYAYAPFNYNLGNSHVIGIKYTF